MEGADVDRGFTKEAQTYLIASFVLAGERESGAEGNVTTNDSMAAHESALDIEQVHRAALALRAASGLPEQLRHDGVRRDPLDQRLTVFAIGADDVVIVPKRRERADSHRFLADIQMAEAADLAEGIGLGCLFLEATNEQHLAQHFEMQVGLRGGGGLRGSGGRGHAVAASTCSQA